MSRHHPFTQRLQFKRADGVSRAEIGIVHELKFSGGDDSNAMTFECYGAIFGNVDSYGDVIQKGAFKKFIKDVKAGREQWPAMLSQHGGYGMSADDLTPIGLWTDMEEDDTGLLLKGECAATARGTEMYTLMKMKPRPAISGFSIGYIPVKYRMGTKPDEPRRTLEELVVREISPVTFPANPKARLKKSDLTIRAAENALREVGFSQAEAKAIVANGFKSFAQRDVVAIDDLAAALQRNIDIFNA
jgi:uncharacterized protein